MNKLLRKILSNWVLKNYPKQFETVIKTEYDVRSVRTIFVKKGRIREWRSYDKNGNKLPKPIF